MPATTPKLRPTGLALKPNPMPHPSPKSRSNSHCSRSTHLQSKDMPHAQLDSDSDSEDTPTPSYTTTLRLRATIATVPDEQLREIMVRLLDRNPGFQHAVAKELLAGANPLNMTPPPSPRRKRRRSGRRSLDVPSASERPCLNCGTHRLGKMGEGTCVYHPGRLEEEIYEFPSRTPEGHAFQVRRKITMWSCCDEDARSPGYLAPAQLPQLALLSFDPLPPVPACSTPAATSFAL
ncbi:hypothetical protein H0H81_011746 [Sphagnurus paluster]|uniref:Uncharacterized protein n=1 Tax=Sphagnurus paluster TaxID=117069 RepID=A0A9P7GPJ7_9AGAR|nr:hypothetical protein H0H81_011746 [Sphagnurus paluster]